MKVFGIFSDERALRSRSPGMHNRILRLTGIEGVYVPFCVRPGDLGDAVRGFRALGLAGANVTVPYKQAIVPHLDTIADEAKALEAVNTIVRDGDRLVGHNTDVRGFLDALDAAGFDPAGRTALVFGTGGAARAIVYALGELGCANVLVIGRDVEKARRLTNELGVGQALDTRYLGGRGQGEGDRDSSRSLPADLVVNATAVSAPTEAPEMAELAGGLKIEGCSLVVDINYGRKENFWRELATRHHARFLDGLPMLAYQARRSFALWTGVGVDPAEFLKALEEDS
jgi:shikimate dehydrogenase